MTEEKIVESTIGIETLTLDITKPLAMKFENIEFRKLTLMTGLNGSGKSFLLVHCYVFTEIATQILAGQTGESLLVASQFILDNSFSEIDTCGTMSGNFTNGAVVKLCMDNGKITSVDHSGFKDVTGVNRIKYMSSAVRTFDSIKAYLQLRKMSASSINNANNHELIFADMLKAYRLYDVAYLERLILSMPYNDKEKITEFISSFKDISEKVVEFNVDLEKPDFFLVNDAGEKKYLTTFSKGHQSIFNMLLGNLI